MQVTLLIQSVFACVVLYHWLCWLAVEHKFGFESIIPDRERDFDWWRYM